MSINYFDEIFFSSYIKEDDEVLDICHKHVVTILDTIIMSLFFAVILPAFFIYNNTFGLKDLIPFMYFETYLFIVYIILIYKIFDWYNDVWIITDRGIIDLDWQLLKNNIVYIDYNDVRGIELNQKSNWDGILGKGDIIIHLEGEGNTFILEDAKSPGEVVNYIQGILEDKENRSKEKGKSLDDRLFSTLRSVIKEHLEKGGFDNKDDDNNENEENEKIEKVLQKKGTIDLR